VGDRHERNNVRVIDAWWARFYGYNAVGYRNGPRSLPFYGLAGNWPDEFTPVRPTKESEVKVPADMLAIGDNFYTGPLRKVLFSGDMMMRDDAGITCVGITTAELKTLAKWAEQRHRGRANVVFCDGHVEGPAIKALFYDTSDAALRRWNKDNEPHRER